MADITQYLQMLANGVVFGSILALCAIGLTLIYGILNLSNFAHGDSLTFGAYVALFFGASTWAGREVLEPVGLGLALVIGAVVALDRWRFRKLAPGERWTLLGFAAALALAAMLLLVAGPGGAGTTLRVLVLAGLLAIAATVALNVLGEYIIWRPLRRRGATVVSLVIASLGLSILLRNAIQQYFGGDPQNLQRPVDVAPTYFGIYISNEAWFTVATAAILIALVHVFLTRTRTGKAMRALADNRDLARVCGIDVDRIITYVWAIGGALVAVAGIMLTLIQNNNMMVNMGFGLLIPIFASVVLGGIGSAYGAMAGGLVVGIAMRLGPPEYDLAAAFVVLILVLLVRPQGILGRKA